MAETARISVVIAARNMEKYLDETLDSVLSQKIKGFEVILVDDGSTDSTSAIAAARRDVRLRVLQGPGRGVSAARNTGLDQVRAPLVVFLDGDDVLMPGTLAAMVRAMEEKPECPAAFAGHIKLDEAGQSLFGSARNPVEAGRDTLRHLLMRNVFVNGGTLAIRTGAARAVGGYTEHLTYGEDWEFWCRLALLGDFLALPGVLALGYRQRTDGANHRKSGSASRPNFSPINAIFNNVMITSHFTTAELREARRQAEANVFWSSARSTLAAGEFGRFLGYIGIGFLRHRSGMLQSRLALRYLGSLMRLAMLPPARQQAVRK
jgi:glycosyltransferase involved in cell wall biosynthesis